MKRWMITFLLAAVCTVFSWAQAQKTFVKSVPLNGMHHVVAAVQGDVNTSKWDSDYLRVTVTVEVSNFSEDILKRLVEVGRYDIQAVEQNGAIYLTMPKINTPVSIKGTQLVEKITYEIVAPQKVVVDVNQPETTMGSL